MATLYLVPALRRQDVGSRLGGADLRRGAEARDGAAAAVPRVHPRHDAQAQLP
jgi:hypothetical protein